MAKRHQMLASLRARGFDKSWSAAGVYRPQCSQCEALVINGIAAHETGCPNAMHECKGCNELIPANQTWCEACR